MQSKDSSFDEGRAQNLSTLDNYSLTGVIANEMGYLPNCHVRMSSASPGVYEFESMVKGLHI